MKICFSDEAIMVHSSLKKKEPFWLYWTMPINCHVPYGSIIGSIFIIRLLFLLYINDILQPLPDSHIYQYADSFSILYQHKVIMEIENALNKGFINANSLLIKGFQFIVLRSTLNAFCLARKTTW